MSKHVKRLGMLLAMAALAVSVAGAVGVKGAKAAAGISATRSDSLMCPITTTVTTYKEARFNGFFLETHDMVRTTTHIGPNGAWFAGCRIGVKVQLMYGPYVLRTIDHEAGAGALFDPWGNNKWYTWYDEVPAGYLDYTNGLA